MHTRAYGRIVIEALLIRLRAQGQKNVATKHLAGGKKHRDKRKAPIAGGLTFGWCGI